MTRIATLAAIQPPPVTAPSPGEVRQKLIDDAFSLLDEAASKGGDLACLPEHFTTTGIVDTGERLIANAEPEDSPLLQRLISFARERRINIVAPVHERRGDTVHNVAWIISRNDGLIGKFHKVHLTNGEYDRGIVPGDSWPTFDLDIGRIGVLICHDMSFPESARCLALQDAEILCWPTMWSGWGDTADEIVIRSRAVDNGVYLMTSNYGTPVDQAWRPGMRIGKSSIIGPDATTLASMGRIPGVAVATVDLDRTILKHDFSTVGDHDYRIQFRATRRPETYETIIAPADVAQQADPVLA